MSINEMANDEKQKISLPLPIEELPPEWENDQRMTFFYSIFQKREADPVNWTTKMNFWKTYLQKYFTINGIICFNETKVKYAFLRKDKLPSCLMEVFDELQREAKIIPEQEFLKQGYKGQSWASWATSIAGKSSSFAMKKLWGALGYDSNNTNTQTFLSIDALKIKADVVLRKYCPDTECIHTSSNVIELNTFIRNEGNEEAKLILIWLCKNNKAFVDETFDPALVKFGHKTTITNMDKQMFALKKQDAALKRKLNILEEEREKARLEAKDFLNKNLRNAAKSCLRRKKEIDRRIEKLADSIANVNVLLSHVEDTESNAKVIESYKSTAAALKATYKDAGLSEDGAAATMDNLEEALDMNEDVKSLISQPLSPGGLPIDESELENELAELLAADDGYSGGGDGGTTAKDLDFTGLLPDVPTTPISASIASIPQQRHVL